MKHKSLRLSIITDRRSDAIQSCCHTCQFINLIEEQRPDQSTFFKSIGSKELQMRLMDCQIGGEWENGIEVYAVVIQ